MNAVAKHMWRALPASALAPALTSYLRLNANYHKWSKTMPGKRHQQSRDQKGKRKKAQDEARASFSCKFIILWNFFEVLKKKKYFHWPVSWTKHYLCETSILIVVVVARAGLFTVRQIREWATYVFIYLFIFTLRYVIAPFRYLSRPLISAALAPALGLILNILNNYA